MLYTFEAQPSTGEMTVNEGEVLTVTRQDVGEGWWEGTNTRGQSGLFPAAYVELQVLQLLYHYSVCVCGYIS